MWKNMAASVSRGVWLAFDYGRLTFIPHGLLCVCEVSALSTCLPTYSIFRQGLGRSSAHIKCFVCLHGMCWRSVLRLRVSVLWHTCLCYLFFIFTFCFPQTCVFFLSLLHTSYCQWLCVSGVRACAAVRIDFLDFWLYCLHLWSTEVLPSVFTWIVCCPCCPHFLSSNWQVKVVFSFVFIN